MKLLNKIIRTKNQLLRHGIKSLKWIGILIIILCLSTSGFAQISGKINGKVIDSVTMSPVDYATVSIYKTGASSPFNGATTDSEGNFTIGDVSAGKYYMKLDFLGYRSKTLNQVIMTGKTPVVTLGSLFLSPVQNQLATVEIMAKNPMVENKIDKLVYNAANDLTSQGGVALDVLRKVPMVSVDIDGNVELQGNANVRFLINGKPSSIFGASLVDALQAIPASQIKNIEVITSPGAKYDAEGTAGIINIILKDSKVQGVNGSVNLSVGNRLQNGLFNLDARKNNFGVNAYFSGNDQVNSTTITTTNRQSYNAAKDTLDHLLQSGKNPFVRNGYQTGISFDWAINPQNNLTASLGYNHTGNHGSGIISQTDQNYLSSGDVLTDVASQRLTTNRFFENSTDYSLDYKKTFKKNGQELDLLYTSTNGREETDAAQTTDYSNRLYPASGLQSFNPGTDRETDISADYAQPVVKGFTLETGVKAVLENIKDNVITDTLLNNGTYLNNSGQTYDFDFRRNIYAGYAATSFSLFNNFFEGKAGIRYERTVTSSDFPGINIPVNNLWVPSFLIQHQLDDSESLKFAYSYRIERPDYEDLDPFLNVIDPNNISTGNPALKNEIGHKYELGYSKSFTNGGSFYLGGYYDLNTNDAQTLNTFYAVYTVNGVNYDNVTLSRPGNIATQTNVGGNLYGSMPLTDKLDIRTNIAVREITNSIPGMPSSSGFNYKINLNADYRFGHDLVAEVFGNYTSRRSVYDGLRPAYLFYTMAVKKQLLNKKLSLGIIASNPFTPYVSQLATNYGLGFTESNLRQIPLRSFGITFGYKFGTLEVKKKDNEEDNNPPLQ